MKLDFIGVFLAILILYLVQLDARANDNFRWNGFVSQGLIQAEDSNFVNDDGGLSARLTELGINFSYRLSDSLRVAAQGVYLNGGNRYPSGTRVDYLFLDWNVVSSPNLKLNLHVGRNKNTHWLYSSTRDVPHTRPTIILPQSIYFDVFRDITLGKDGAALHANLYNSLGEWEASWSYGASEISDEQSQNLLGRMIKGNVKHNFENQFSISFRPTDSQFQLGIAGLRAEFEFQKAQQDPLYEGSAQIERVILQARYTSQNWDVDAEAMLEQVTYWGILTPQFYDKSAAQGGFIQGRYFVNKDITLISRIDWFDRNKRDRDGSRFSAISGGRIPAYFAFMDQATIGVSWDFTPKWRLSAEWHKVKGRGRLGPVLSPNLTLNNQKYWDLWALQLMHWF